MKSWSFPLAFVLAVASVVGCGRVGQGAPLPEPVAPPATVPVPQPDQPAQQGDAQAGLALLQRMRQRLQSAQGVEAMVRSFSEGRFKAGKPVQELRRSTYRTRLLWQKPARMRGDVLDTDNWLVSGASMVTTDGRNVKVKASGFLGLFPINVKVDDDLLASNRNHKFGDLAPDAMFGRLMGPSAAWWVVGRQTLGGRPMDVIEVRGVPPVDAAIRREILAVDPGDLTVGFLRMYDATHMVVDYTFQTFRWDPRLSSDAFRL